MCAKQITSIRLGSEDFLNFSYRSTSFFRPLNRIEPIEFLLLTVFILSIEGQRLANKERTKIGWKKGTQETLTKPVTMTNSSWIKWGFRCQLILKKVKYFTRVSMGFFIWFILWTLKLHTNTNTKCLSSFEFHLIFIERITYITRTFPL